MTLKRIQYILGTTVVYVKKRSFFTYPTLCQRGSPFDPLITALRAEAEVMNTNTENQKTGAPGTTKLVREPLKNLFHFRLTDADAAIWNEKIDRSGMRISEFIRAAVIENQTVVHGDLVRKTKKNVRTPANIDPNIRQRNFLLAQASNNINQIAHKLNLDHKLELVTPATYSQILLELQSISIELKKGV